MLENALVAGITSLGVDVLVIGPLPTPGLLTSLARCAPTPHRPLASHNPYQDTASNFSGTTATTG